MGGGDGDAVEDGVDGDVGETLLFVERDAELVEVAEEFGIGVLEGLQRGFLLGSRVVADILKIDGRIPVVGPGREFHGQEFVKRLQAEFQHPLRFLFQGRDQTNGFFREAFRD